MKLEGSDIREGHQTRGNKWKTSYPRKGWTEVDVIDTGEFPGGECDFCGTQYRYEHKLFHKTEGLDVAVGVVCAEHLTEDYVNPAKRESALKKRNRWVSSPKWKESNHGNIYRKDDSVLIYTHNDNYKVRVGDTWGKKEFRTQKEAKVAVFNYLYGR